MSEQSKLGLGQIITKPQNRDAIHVAVAPVIAAIDLFPGQHVGFNPDGHAGVVENPIGIVDPFLRHKVTKGEQFWLYLYPGSITSLRHEWTHPAFQKDVKNPEKSASEHWLRTYAVRLKPYVEDPNEAFDGMIRELSEENMVYANGRDLHGLYEMEDVEQFFHHAEIYLGRTFHREEVIYTCAC